MVEFSVKIDGDLFSGGGGELNHITSQEEITPDSNNYFQKMVSLYYLVGNYIIGYYPASFYDVYLDLDYEAREVIGRRDHEISMAGYPLARAVINENEIAYIKLYDDEVIGVCDTNIVIGALICARNKMIGDFKREIDRRSPAE